MKSMRIFLTLTLALLLAGGAWLPAGRSAADDSPPPEGLTAPEWQGIQTQIAKLTAADGATGDYFGTDVSVDGDTAIVGSERARVGGNANLGAAYVFYRNQGGPDAWGLVVKLTAADGMAYDRFGLGVSVSGDTAVVAADRADIGGRTDQGAAYVFYRNQGGPDAWGQVAKLTASDGAAYDGLGWVSVTGDTALAGAAWADVGGRVDQGAAYVFYRDQGGPDAWGQVAKLTAADGAAGDSFGCSASVDGDTAVVGAMYADVGGNGDQGAAYVFYRNQGGPDAWGQVAKLTSADGRAGDWFGSGAPLDGDTLVVGAMSAGVGSHRHQGAAYVFYRHRGGPDAWGQVAKLTAADGAVDDHLGYLAASISGDTAVVGAIYADVGGRVDQGAAWVFYLTSLHLTDLRLDQAPGSAPGTYYLLAFPLVHDQDHAPAAKALVYGRWDLPDGTVANRQELTNANGWGNFVLVTTQTGGFRFCVRELAKRGYYYDRPTNEAPACKGIAVGP